ncbi:MAG: hypothetical protein ABIA04_15260 [Pseudomonadota bacterium]
MKVIKLFIPIFITISLLIGCNGNTSKPTSKPKPTVILHEPAPIPPTPPVLDLPKPPIPDPPKPIVKTDIEKIEDLKKLYKRNSVLYQLANIKHKGETIYDFHDQYKDRPEYDMQVYIKFDFEKMESEVNVYVRHYYFFEYRYEVTGNFTIENGKIKVRYDEIFENNEIPKTGGSARIEITKGFLFKIGEIIQFEHPIFYKYFKKDYDNIFLIEYYFPIDKLFEETLIFDYNNLPVYTFKRYFDPYFFIDSPDMTLSKGIASYELYQDPPVPIKAYHSRTNNLNAISKDDVFFYEPIITGTKNDDNYQLIISALLSKEYLASEDNSKARKFMSEYQALVGIPDVKYVQVVLYPYDDEEVPIELEVKEFDTNLGEVIYEFNNDKTGPIADIGLRFFNNNKEKIDAYHFQSFLLYGIGNN